MSETELERAIRAALGDAGDLSDEALLVRLGRQVALSERAPDHPGSAGGVEALSEAGSEEALEALGGIDLSALKSLGRGVVERMEPQLHDLICGDDPEHNDLRRNLAERVADIGCDDLSIAAMIAAKLVTSLGMAQSVAAVVALIVARRVLQATVDQVCMVWSQRMATRRSGGIGGSDGGQEEALA